MKTLEATRELIKNMALSIVEDTKGACLEDIRLAREYLEGMQYATILYDHGPCDDAHEFIQTCINYIEQKENDIVCSEK